MNSIIVGLLGGFFVYLVFLSIQVIRLQKENDNFRSQFFSIRWNLLDLKDKLKYKKQQNDHSVIHSNDPISKEADGYFDNEDEDDDY